MRCQTCWIILSHVLARHYRTQIVNPLYSPEQVLHITVSGDSRRANRRDSFTCFALPPLTPTALRKPSAGFIIDIESYEHMLTAEALRRLAARIGGYHARTT